MNLNTVVRDMSRNLSYYNRGGVNQTPVILICSIENINEEKFMVDVFVPSTASKINNVIIGIGVISEHGTAITTLPTKGQKGVILLAPNQPPILIAMIPNQRNENKSLLLKNELLLGNKNSSIKISKDDSNSIKTPTAIFNMRNNTQKSILNKAILKTKGSTKEEGSDSFGYSVEEYNEINYENLEYSKKDILKNSSINQQSKIDILDTSALLTSKLLDMIELVKKSNEAIGNDIEKSANILSELEENINSFGVKKGSKTLKIIKGRRGDSENIFKVCFEEDSKEKSSLEFNSDGNIILNCSDLIINKEDM